MTRLELGLIGALAGALFVIVLHPATRPVVQIGLTRFGPSQFLQTSQDVPGNAKVLPDPTSISVVARWVREGCRKVVEHESPSVDQLLTLVELCQQSAESEEDNAFWRQSEGVFQNYLGNSHAAASAWEKAAECQDWDDHQLNLLQSVETGLKSEFGRTMSWHDLLVLNLRDDICERAIADYAAVYLRAQSHLSSRFITLRNGMLLRNGSKTVAGSLVGWSVVEKAASGINRVGGSPRETVAQRFQFVDELSRGKLQSEALEAREILSSNEAYGPQSEEMGRRNR